MCTNDKKVNKTNKILVSNFHKSFIGKIIENTITFFAALQHACDYNFPL